MNTTTAITCAVSVLVLALSATACSANVGADTPQSRSTETGSVSQPLLNNGGGTQGYTCTDSGYCQCSGVDDCDAMFLICKSSTYCNTDPYGGFRCCCLDYVTRTSTTLTGSVATGSSTTLVK